MGYWEGGWTDGWVAGLSLSLAIYSKPFNLFFRNLKTFDVFHDLKDLEYIETFQDEKSTWSSLEVALKYF